MVLRRGLQIFKLWYDLPMSAKQIILSIGGVVLGVGLLVTGYNYFIFNSLRNQCITKLDTEPQELTITLGASQSQARIKALTESIQQIDGTQEVTVESASSALDDFATRHQDDPDIAASLEVLKQQNENPLSSTIAVLYSSARESTSMVSEVQTVANKSGLVIEKISTNEDNRATIYRFVSESRFVPLPLLWAGTQTGIIQYAKEPLLDCVEHGAIHSAKSNLN